MLVKCERSEEGESCPARLPLPPCPIVMVMPNSRYSGQLTERSGEGADGHISPSFITFFSIHRGSLIGQLVIGQQNKENWI